MSSIRVIVVDDSERDLRAIGRMLESSSQGIEVVGSFDTGPSALAAVETTDFDVAVVDFRMPEMDGLQLAAALKRARPGCKVVILTAYDDARDSAEASGNVDHFQEKVDVENLDLAVKRLHEGAPTEPVGGRRGIFGRRR